MAYDAGYFYCRGVIRDVILRAGKAGAKDRTKAYAVVAVDENRTSSREPKSLPLVNAEAIPITSAAADVRHLPQAPLALS